MATWMDVDTGEPVEELVPKPRRGRVTAAEKQQQTAEQADLMRKQLEEEGSFVSPKKEESYPGPVVEPPLHTDEEIKVLEAAAEMFADSMSPAEAARIKDEVEVLRKEQGAVKKPLHVKLVEVMMAVDAVGKRGENQAQSYKYQRAVDVFNAVRPEFIKRGMLFLTEVTSSKTTVIERGGGKSPNILVEIECVFTVTDGMETVRFRGAGAGIDVGGDKSVYKAITGSMKYGIRQLLMLPDENDPEKDRPGEREDVFDGPMPTITSAPPVSVQQGGRQTQATSAQISAIRDASRELMLNPDALAAFIVSTTGAGPAIDPDMPVNQQSAVVLKYLENLSFSECGAVVKGLMEAVEKNASGAA